MRLMHLILVPAALFLASMARIFNIILFMA